MAVPGTKSAVQQVTFSGNGTVTLSGSFAKSDPIAVDFAKRITVIPSYMATWTGTTLDFTVEVNPMDADSDPNDAYWSQAGKWFNNSGSATEVPITYSVSAGSANVFRAGTPLDISDLNAAQVRFSVKEGGTPISAGSARIFIVKSDIS